MQHEKIQMVKLLQSYLQMS